MQNDGLSPAGRLARYVGLAGWAALWVTLIVAAAWAQLPIRTRAEVYPESSPMADSLLRNAAQLARDRQWAEAVEIYQRVIQQFGDKVTLLPKDDPASDPSGVSFLLVDARQCCQRRIAALPPEARALYRARVDAQAERWFRQGAAERDRTLLRRVVDEAFCSSWGDDALELLGDLAFQDGRFTEALAAYRQLVPDRASDPLGLTHPDPSVDLALVAAKKLLARAALGEDPPRRADLDAFAAAYPNATGSLAGRTGPLLKSLNEALAEDHLALPAQLDGSWPTFAGAPARTKIAPGPIDVGSFQWKVDLDVQTTTLPFRNNRGMFPQPFGRGTTPSVDRPLAYYPIVVDDLVIACDDKQILAFNLNDRPSGSPTGTVDLAWKHEHQPFSTPTATRLAAVPPRFTLTAYGDRIYARLGPPGPMVARGFGGGQVPSAIVAVDRSTDGKLLWKRPSTDITLPLRKGEGRMAGFEGTPVADAHNVYVALTEGGVQTATFVACLDAETGTTRWIRFLFEAPAAHDNGMGMGMLTELSHRLLTLDGSTIYYQTNLGAVASLDAETGRIRWLATYPRQERTGGSMRDRELNPAIVHNGLVIVAPDDTSKIYAFDAVTGRLVWRTDSDTLAEVTHLLGVAKGHLIATGNHVWTVDIHTGKIVSRWPDSKPGFEGYGRGLLAGDYIYWPTKTEIHILDQETGLPAERPPIKLQAMFQTSGGNLAVGDGYLIVAQPDALVVFCQNSRLIERYRDEIAHAPDQASNYYRLAQAAESTDQDGLALESLEETIRKARPSDVVDGQPLSEIARDHEYRLLMKLAAKAVAARNWALAARRYDEAARAARAERDRLAAGFRLADVQAESGDPHASVVTLQGLLADERLRPLSVATDKHRTVRADLLISDRLAALIQQRGRAIYADFDREAERLLERGKAEKDPRLLEEVGRSYPVAEAVPAALLVLGQLCDSLDRPAESAQAYKKLLAAASGDSDRARALWGLARAYEAQQLWGPARDTYLQALARFADQPIAGTGSDGTLGTLVAARLARAPFDRLPNDRSEPSLPFPLTRRWGRLLETAIRPLESDGVPPSAQASRIFLADRTTLRPVDPVSGAAPWKADLGEPPIWVGYLADRVIAATATKLVALNLQKGTVEWRSDIEAPRSGRRVANPFAKPEAGDGRANTTPDRFHDFRIVGGRIFCQRGHRELLAFDGDTGLIDWSYVPASGQLNPHLWIGPQRIVLQVRKPNAVFVLETASGRCRAEYAQGDVEEWPREPFPLDDDNVVLVVDRRSVALFDINRGVFPWSTPLGEVLPRNGAPRILGDAEHLLVLYDGNKLIRLNPRTGGRLWDHTLGYDDLSERPESLAFDDDRFHWATPGQNMNGVKTPAQLEAISLADGKVVWSRFLTGPETAWAITLTERCVAAYPIPPRSAEGELNNLPLVFCRRDTGALVQRLLIQTSVSDLAVRLAPQGVLIATQTGLWALGEHAAVDEVKTP